jgi:hypothetical protein
MILQNWQGLQQQPQLALHQASPGSQAQQLQHGAPRVPRLQVSAGRAGPASQGPPGPPALGPALPTASSLEAATGKPPQQGKLERRHHRTWSHSHHQTRVVSIHRLTSQTTTRKPGSQQRASHA